jgi:hypothetical protein
MCYQLHHPGAVEKSVADLARDFLPLLLRATHAKLFGPSSPNLLGF